MSVDTVYAQIVNGQDMNIALFGQAAEEIIGRADTTNLATLFTQTTTLTIDTFSNNSYLCNSLRPPSSLSNSSNSSNCDIPAGPYGLGVSIPFYHKNYFTTLNTELRALDPFGNEILCLTVATTPLEPGPLRSPYGKARSIFWATISLAIAYWIIVGIARIASAWGRGSSRPASGIWARVESAGFVLVSAISGERLATSPSLLRFCSPSLRDIMVHTQWCAALAMIAVQWPPFVYPLLSQTAWATLTYNISLSSHATRWNPLSVQPYNPPSDFATQTSDPSSPLYLNSAIPNTLFLLPSGTNNGIEAFAWSVGVRPQDLFRICLAIFLSILAGTVALSILVWLIDLAFSRKPSSGLSTGATFSSPATKSRSPRQSAGSKDMLDASGDESRSLNGHSHSYPLLRRRWWFRSNFGSFHSSVLVGNLVRVHSLFHLPVTIFSVYQFSSMKDATSITLAVLSFAFFSILLPAFLILRLARTSTTKLYDETRTLLALGPLYNHFRPDSQMFSGLLFLSNLINGIAIGCGQRSGTAQAIVILVSEVVSALVTSVWLPWGTGAGMGLLSFLFCVARIVTAVLLVILTPTISIGDAAGGWVAYGILVVLLLVYLAFTLILLVKVIEAFVRMFGCVGFDRSSHAMDSGLVGVLGLLGCCGGGSRRGRERGRYRATELPHTPPNRGSISVRDSSSYVPPNASFVQGAKGSAASHSSAVPPPSVLRPEHALRPYREDSDDDDESTHIMGAWQPFPNPGGRPSYDLSELTPPQASSSGFSRVGGGRAHYESPYAIAGGSNKVADGSTLTFPSVERRGSGSPAKTARLPRDVDDGVSTSMTSVANVARLPVLTNSGLPVGAMMPHARTKSQTAIIVGELAGMANPLMAAQESHPMLEPEAQRRSAALAVKGVPSASVAGDVEAGIGAQPQQPPKKKGWFNIRRNRRHSDGQILENATEAEDSSALHPRPETGRSFVVIREKKPLSSQPNPNPQGRKPSQSLDESSPKPPFSSFTAAHGSTSNDTQRSS